MKIERLNQALGERYRVNGVLGHGAMGTVYLANDLRHDRPVALKVLKSEFADSLGTERFLREITVTARLDHPHVLPLLDSGEADGLLYYVMPYVEGESLRDRLNREKHLSLQDALVITGEIADALSYAHSHGILHRDIKPENILLARGHARVADFGVARALTTAGGDTLTETGLAVGTPLYMSPEQALGEGELDARTDIYSLGCVLYEMLMGTPPFFGSTPLALLTRKCTEAVPRLQSETVPDTVERVITRALVKTPADRYSSAAELATALNAAYSEAFTSGLAADRAGRFQVTRAFSAAQASAASEHHGRAAIVILPFANMSPEQENEYFSDGLTEEITTDLSRIESLSVISRMSAMCFKGTTRDVRAIGRELGVQYVLEGSVRKSRNNLRITAQLIDAATGAHLWAEKYSGVIDDVFDVQERVSREIVRTLQLSLSAEEDRTLAHREILDARAFELYLQARQEIRHYGDGPERAQELLAAAAAIEGNTPPLRALRGWAQVAQVKAGLNRDLAILDVAEREAHAILLTSPGYVRVHSLLAYVQFERGNLAEAVYHFREALTEDPTDPDALLYLGLSYVYAGQFDLATEISDQLIACDPLGSFTWVLAGVVRWFPGRFDDAIEPLRRAIELDPQNVMGRWSCGYALAAAGQLAEASEQATWLQEVAPHVPYTTQLISLILAMTGQQARALQALASVDAGPLDQHATFHLAESCAAANAQDRALDLLSSAVRKGFYPYSYLREHCPFLAPLRPLRRFTDILEEARRRHEAFIRDERIVHRD